MDDYDVYQSNQELTEEEREMLEEYQAKIKADSGKFWFLDWGRQYKSSYVAYTANFVRWHSHHIGPLQESPSYYTKHLKPCWYKHIFVGDYRGSKFRLLAFPHTYKILGFHISFFASHIQLLPIYRVKISETWKVCGNKMFMVTALGCWFDIKFWRYFWTYTKRRIFLESNYHLWCLKSMIISWDPLFSTCPKLEFGLV